MKELKNRIAAHRAQFGYNQSDLAGLIGVSKNTVSAWELSQSLPRVDRAFAMSEVLNCSVYDLFPIWAETFELVPDPESQVGQVWFDDLEDLEAAPEVLGAEG